MLRLKATTADDPDRLPSYEVPPETDPLETLLAGRAEDVVARDPLSAAHTRPSQQAAAAGSPSARRPHHR